MPLQQADLMEPQAETSSRLPNAAIKHPLAACALIASIFALATLAVSSQLESTPDLPLAETAPAIQPYAEPEPDREAMRDEFFRREVEPRILETDALNREAADRCVERLARLIDRYRGGIDPFVEDLTSISTRLGIVRRMPGGWWKKDGRVESYVQDKFESHLFSEETLASDVAGILEAFRIEVDANQKRMVTSIRASLDTADLPEVEMGDYDAFLHAVAEQLQTYSMQQGTSSVQNALTVLLLSEAGSFAAVSIASGMLARFGAAAATTAVAAGGATAGGAATGAGGGSLGGPVGTAVGLGVGLVIGIAIDWWMTEKFEEELSQKMHLYVDSLEEAIIYGTPAPNRSGLSETSAVEKTGIANALPVLCTRLRVAYEQRFYDQIISLEPSS